MCRPVNLLERLEDDGGAICCSLLGWFDWIFSAGLFLKWRTLQERKIQPRPNFSKATKFSNTINTMTWNTFRNCTRMCKNVLVFFSVISFIPNHKCLSAVEMNKIRLKCCKNCNTGTCRSNFLPLNVFLLAFKMQYLYWSLFFIQFQDFAGKHKRGPFFNSHAIQQQNVSFPYKECTHISLVSLQHACSVLVCYFIFITGPNSWEIGRICPCICKRISQKGCECECFLSELREDDDTRATHFSPFEKKRLTNC